MNMMRLKLVSLNIKWSMEVDNAAKIWKLPIKNVNGMGQFMESVNINRGII